MGLRMGLGLTVRYSARCDRVGEGEVRTLDGSFVVNFGGIA